MATDCIPQLAFKFDKLVVAKFDVEHASSDGGAVLLKAVDRQLGVTSTVARSLRDPRQPGKVQHAVLAQDLLRVTEATPTEDALREGLSAAVMTGLVVSEGELIEGSVAVAAPLFREDGIVGAIGLLAPAFRADPAWRTRSGRLVAEAARTINAALAEDGSG